MDSTTAMRATTNASAVDVPGSQPPTEANAPASLATENVSGTRPFQDSDTVSVSAADRVLANDALYDTWASTYDSDGNVLQAVDDFQMLELIPALADLVREHSKQRPETQCGPRVLDLGCGTGRNTIKLLRADWGGSAEVSGWEPSGGMLEIAKDKCNAVMRSQGPQSSTELSLQQVGISEPGALPSGSVASFDAVISTLVLEHVPQQRFFAVVAALLRPGGHGLISNMHSGMGTQTRAGFKTDSGERVKGSSYVYTVDGSIQAARDAGLDVVDCWSSGAPDGVREVAIDDGMIQRGVVGQRGRKWVGTKIWYGMLVRKS